MGFWKKGFKLGYLRVAQLVEIIHITAPFSEP